MVESTQGAMMSDLQHFCLRWNNYQSSITSAFENLRDDEDFIDVTLACDGKSLKAHRVVLSACSPYFRELLKTTPCKHPVIVLQDVVWEDLHALVEFIYHGQVNVHQKNLTSFLKTAEVLRVSGLTQNSTDINRESGSPYSKVPSEKSHSDSVSDLSPRPDASRYSSLNQGRHRSSPLSNKHLSSPLAHDIPSKRAKINGTPEDLSSTSSTINESNTTSCNKVPTPTLPDQPLPAKLPNSSTSSNEDEFEEREEERPEDDLSDAEEPPVDFSITPHRGSPELKKKRDRTLSKSPNTIKSEPSEWSLVPAGNNNNYSHTSHHNDDSNDSVSNSINSYRNHLDRYGDSLHDDSLQGAHSYLDSKIFAAAGASFNFSMAAALAADSLAGLNNSHHNSGNTGTLDLTGASSSQGLVMPPPMSGGINEPQDCPYCRRTFSCYYSLKRHFQDKHERSDTLYVCEFCHRRYRTKNSLTTHKSLQHRGTSGMLKRLLKGGSTGSYDYRASTSLLFDITYNNNNNISSSKNNNESHPKETF